MGDLIPIETVYKGYRFRSRLEARWAVFFDALGEPWEYEKEGFDLPFAGSYLPGFWLPYQQCWAEVKGERMSSEERTKAAALSWATDRWVDVLVGSPGEHQVCSFRMPLGGEKRYVELGLCDNCAHLVFVHHNRRWQSAADEDEDRRLAAEYDVPWAPLSHWYGRCYGCNHEGTYDLDYTVPPHQRDVRLQRAIRAARSARFEFGESGVRSPGRWVPSGLPTRPADPRHGGPIPQAPDPANEQPISIIKPRVKIKPD